MKLQEQNVAKGAGCSREAYRLKKTECLSISTYFNPQRQRKGKGGGNPLILIYMFLKYFFLKYINRYILIPTEKKERESGGRSREGVETERKRRKQRLH